MLLFVVSYELCVCLVIVVRGSLCVVRCLILSCDVCCYLLVFVVRCNVFDVGCFLCVVD